MKRNFVSQMSRFVFLVLMMLAGALCSQSQVKVTTFHYDNFRSGQNLNETILNPSVVNQNSFGKLFSQAVDGQLYGEPLYLPNVAVPGKGTHNVVFVATEHDTVFAFDADNNTGTNAKPLWRVGFVNTAQKISAIPSADVGTSFVSPEIGITSTPVIDPRSGTIYVVAATKEKSKYFQRLHALDVSTGAEKFGGPVVIEASAPGTGWASKDGKISFDPLRNHQRAALLLMNGVVYIAWASHGLENQYPYHGWVLGYNASTLEQVAVHAVTPNGKQGGIWQAGCGLAADNLGNIYYIAGNGSFDANTSGPDYGESYVKLSTTGGGLNVTDYFTPFDQATLSSQDRDLGSGGAVLLPNQTGTAHPNLAIGAGKNGVIYLVDRNNMGHFNASGNSQIVQSITSAFAGHALFNTPAYWQQQMYFWADHDFLRIFGITGGLLTTTPILSTVSFNLGATPVLTSDGNTNGLVWVIQSDAAKTAGPAVLHALDATTAVEVYNSALAGTRDTAGPAVKFSVPTVANGKVYVGTANQLNVYGLF